MSVFKKLLIEEDTTSNIEKRIYVKEISSTVFLTISTLAGFSKERLPL